MSHAIRIKTITIKKPIFPFWKRVKPTSLVFLVINLFSNLRLVLFRRLYYYIFLINKVYCILNEFLNIMLEILYDIKLFMYKWNLGY